MSAALLPLDPPFPALADICCPSDADLLMFARYMQEIAQRRQYRDESAPNSPPETIGRLRSSIDWLAMMLAERIERDRQLAERLEYEARQEAQHATLLEVDDDYAAEWGKFSDGEDE